MKIILSKGENNMKKVIKITKIKYFMLKNTPAPYLNKTRKVWNLQSKNSQILNNQKRSTRKQTQEIMGRKIKREQMIEIGTRGIITEKKSKKTKIHKRRKSIIF